MLHHLLVSTSGACHGKFKLRHNDLWIHKDFIGNKNWNNSQAIKDLLNGKTLNNFSIMFDEAIDCVKGLDI